MTRDDLREEVLQSSANNILCELPTGVGKSKIAIDFIKGRYSKGDRILIVIPKLALIENWKEEFKKWKCEGMLGGVVFTTYVSYPKHVGEWGFVIYDECFKGDTEILTNSGYKQFRNLTEEDLVAQWTDEGNIEFVKPIRFIKRWHSDKICKLHLKRDRYLYVTPNHNQPYYNSKKDVITIKPIQKLSKNGSYKYLTTGKGTGNNALLTSLEKLYIAIQADGTLQRHQINESVYSIQVTKQRKKDRLKNLLESYSNYTRIKGRSGVDRYMIKLPKGDAKLLSTHFDINMGYDRANNFINEVVQWDGSMFNNQLYYSSKIKENSDFVAAVAVQAGYQIFQSVESDNRKENFSDIHRVYMKRPSYKFGDISLGSLEKEYIDYNDYVYCVEVPSHKIVIRSEGITLISGNCHHLTERCYDVLPEMKANYNILLSATVGYNKRSDFKYFFRNLEIFKVGVRKTIEEDILPDPRVYLIPLKLDNTMADLEIVKNSKCKQFVMVKYADRYKYSKVTNMKVIIKCTQQQYYDNICSLINYYKFRSHNRQFMELYLRECGTRLKWLSNEKTRTIEQILKVLDNKRTLTFCNSIVQTEVLGKYCINSKNKDSMKHLAMFNEGKVNHITSVAILDEGMNLADCEVGVFAMLNSSDRIILQRLGRLLRHRNPAIVIPYYVNTREEEIVDKMLQDYNPELVTTVNNIKELKI